MGLNLKKREKMKIFKIALIALLVIPMLICISTAKENDSLLYPYPYIANGENGAEKTIFMLPYLTNSTPGKEFWFEHSANNKSWGIDWDKERMPFTTVVIHHSAGKANETPEEMETIAKEKYIARYNSSDNDPYVKGLEPHSFHIVSGKETFLPYHYLIYENGTTINWLNPLIQINKTWFVDNVAWHAGNWSINCQSLSIVLVGDYSNSSPTKEQLSSLKELINELKRYNDKIKVVPHYEINSKTNCPGEEYSNWAIN